MFPRPESELRRKLDSRTIVNLEMLAQKNRISKPSSKERREQFCVS